MNEEEIKVRVTAEQKRDATAAAEREGLSLSAWLRRLLVLALQGAK